MRQKRLLIFAVVWSFAAIAFSQSVESDVLAYIRTQVAAGAKEIRVPKGCYRLAPQGETYLSLRGLTGVTIDFGGSEFVGTVKTQMISMHHCTNVVLRNLFIDYDPLTFTQGVITHVDTEKNWDVKIIDGYPCPEGDEVGLDMVAKVWPVQVYDKDTLELKNPMRFQNETKIEKTGRDIYRVSGGIDRRGDVGDVCVWSIREHHHPFRRQTIATHRCAGCLFEDVICYATPYGSCAFAEMLACSNTFRRCAVKRRPPEDDPVKRGMKRLRSGNHDAFNSRVSIMGPTLENCTFRHHCDDCVNISGFYAIVTKQEGRRLRVLASNQPGAAGDRAQIMTFEGRCPPEVTMLSMEAVQGGITPEEFKFLENYGFCNGIEKNISQVFEITIDRDEVLPHGSVIASTRVMGNGFVIRGGDFGSCRARGLLVKASDGLIESNHISGCFGPAVVSAPEYQWLEAGCSANLVIRNNVFTDNLDAGVYVGGRAGNRNPLPSDSHRNVVVVDNRISGSAKGIVVEGCTGVTVKGNIISTLSNAEDTKVVLRNCVRIDAPVVLKLGAPFSDGAVLQRDRPVPVWGRGDPGAPVTVSFAGQAKTGTADAYGKWLVHLDPMPASATPRDLVVSQDLQPPVVIRNILVGEVWFASGQSNMKCPIKGPDPRFRDGQGRLAVGMTREPDVRFFKVRSRWSVTPREDTQDRWYAFTPEDFDAITDRPTLSAVAFYYALDVYRAAKVPVGIFEASEGGTNIDAWMPRSGLATRPDLKDVFDYPVKENWRGATDARGVISGPDQQPTVLWNAMVAPYAPYALRGLIWYQGCHNASEPQRYASKMHALYAGWAKEFANPELELYFVSLAPYKMSWFDIQQAQQRYADEEPHAALVISCDVGNPRDVHPNDKRTIAHRLAAHALKRVYGFTHLENESPRVKSATASDGTVTLRFAHAKKLYFYNVPRVRPDGFELAGADGKWHPAEVVNAVAGKSSDGSTYYPGLFKNGARHIELRASAVPVPQKVRYLYESPWTGCLYNESDLPLGSFACDVQEE